MEKSLPLALSTEKVVSEGVERYKPRSGSRGSKWLCAWKFVLYRGSELSLNSCLGNRVFCSMCGIKFGIAGGQETGATLQRGMSDSTLVVLSFSLLNGDSAADATEALIFEVRVKAEDEEFGGRFSKSRSLCAVEYIFGALYIRHRCFLHEYSRRGRFVIDAARLRIGEANLPDPN